MLTAHHFTTFVIANLEMENNERYDKKIILDKTIQSINYLGRETVIDRCHDFQLVTCAA